MSAIQKKIDKARLNIEDSFHITEKNQIGEKMYENIVEKQYSFFNKKIMVNKQYKKALYSYKETGYIQMHDILRRKAQFSVDDDFVDEFLQVSKPKTFWKSQEFPKWKNVIKNLRETLYTTEIIPVIEEIAIIDEIMNMSPRLHDDIIVYRGENYDFLDTIQCIKGKSYVTFPTFVSTSFLSSVGTKFMKTNGIICTIHIPKRMKGMFIHWNLMLLPKFENSEIDDEKEFILPRNCKFEIVSVQFFYDENKKRKIHNKYKDISCKENSPILTKHYVLKLVSQATVKELHQTLETAREYPFDILLL